MSGMSGGVTAGPETTIFYITDSLTSPTNYIELATDNLGPPPPSHHGPPRYQGCGNNPFRGLP